METGLGFGELALQVAGGRRAATIKAKSDTELLAINGFEYRAVLAEHHHRDIAHRVRSAPSLRRPLHLKLRKPISTPSHRR